MSGGCLPTSGAITPATPPISTFRTYRVAWRVEAPNEKESSPAEGIASFTRRGVGNVRRQIEAFGRELLLAVFRVADRHHAAPAVDRDLQRQRKGGASLHEAIAQQPEAAPLGVDDRLVLDGAVPEWKTSRLVTRSPRATWLSSPSAS